MCLFNVDKTLISVKAINFFSQSALACFQPYKSIFQKQLGLSTTQNGTVMAVEKLVSLIVPPILGAIADKFSVHKFMMIAFALLSIVFTFPMYFVPAIPKNHMRFSCCSDENVYWCNANVSADFIHQFCSVSANGTVATLCPRKSLSNCSISYLPANMTNPCSNALYSVFCADVSKSDTYNLTFYLLLVLSILLVTTIIPLGTLIDTTVMFILGEERLKHYGKQRLWGSIGFGLLAMVSGFLIDLSSNNASNQNEKNFLVSFLGFSLFQIITSLICYSLNVPEYCQPSILKGVCVLIRSVRVLLLLFVVFVSGFVLGSRFAFTFWYVEQLPGATPSLLGFSVLMACLSEIPWFFWSGWILNKLGHEAVLSFGLLAASLQCYLYTVITVAWPILFIEMMHGLSFALPVAAMCTYAAFLSPVGMTATMLGLIQGVYWGVGNMAGAFLSGILYEEYGATIMFRVNSIFACAAAVVYFTVTRCLSSRQRNVAENKTTEISKETRRDMLQAETSKLAESRV